MRGGACSGSSHGDFFREFDVFAWVDLRVSAAHDRHGETVAPQCTGVTGGIDAQGQAAGDGQTAARQMTCEIERGAAARTGGFARTHHCQLQSGEYLAITADI